MAQQGCPPARPPARRVLRGSGGAAARPPAGLGAATEQPLPPGIIMRSPRITCHHPPPPAAGAIIQEMGWFNLFTRGLPLRIVMIGTLTGLQWGIYDGARAARARRGLPVLAAAPAAPSMACRLLPPPLRWARRCSQCQVRCPCCP